MELLLSGKVPTLRKITPPALSTRQIESPVGTIDLAGYPQPLLNAISAKNGLWAESFGITAPKASQRFRRALPPCSISAATTTFASPRFTCCSV
jgi:hypothetical protein